MGFSRQGVCTHHVLRINKLFLVSSCILSFMTQWSFLILLSESLLNTRPHRTHCRSLEFASKPNRNALPCNVHRSFIFQLAPTPTHLHTHTHKFTAIIFFTAVFPPDIWCWQFKYCGGHIHSWIHHGITSIENMLKIHSMVYLSQILTAFGITESAAEVLLFFFF